MTNIKRFFTAMTAMGIMASTSLPAVAADDLKIEHLGVNNTLVRVTGGDQYLMLPVQENIDDARINVLVDGKIADTFYVRLAKSKTDYVVPFDLSPYKGKNVVLDIVTPQSRSTVREAKEDTCWKGMTLTETFDIQDTEDQYRPAYHHAPLYGWMNDPNGMFYKDGVWHLYYQYNPYGSKWQNMTWAHSTTKDLVNWNHEPIAIRPDGLGSIFSGSSVIDHEGTAGFGKDAVIALFTSAGTSQMQSLAHSSDNGMTFTKYDGNPILTLESEARDPNMFWNPETKEWNLVLAHALDHEMLFFTSPDLKTWTLQSGFGKGEGCQDGVWECPDLFQLPVAGTNEKKWVLICNINPGGPFGGSAIQYFTGDWDGKTFKADTDAQGKVPTKWLDFGKDNYALVSWSDAPDGRRTAIGWMSNWQYAADVPTQQFRSANTLPREIGLFKGPDGQIYASSAPSPELISLRGRLTLSKGSVKAAKKPVSFALPAENKGICEILFDIDGGDKDNVCLTLSNKAGDKVDMVYDPQAHTFSFDRRNSGIVNFSENFPAVTVSPTFEKSGKISLRIFVDKSSIEVFGNDGQFVLTNLVFPTEPYSTLSVSSIGGKAKISNLKIYSLKN
ncbi:MAG: GH32 C-terminal domain-containing protein [Muribaculaceae bacterium]|nr:GH32 C-terminal domain-containing protein [Muribaculaceae bacterium]